ncbi:MAG TPA: choice-of-anchor tandem repeat GloVer-containing protein [Rhizomicrobium sp.]|jgi:uncharacterized repeat protein (TIGR03803 family)
MRQILNIVSWSMLGCALALAAFATGAQARTLRTVYAFAGGSDGQFPEAGLIRDRSGNLYGTTGQGGGGNCNGGCGTVFKLAPDGTKTTLYSFQGGSDGAGPGSIIIDAAGNLYGTTNTGGDADCYGHSGCGVIFRLDPDGRETVLHAFANGKDGANPGALIRDRRGNLYGTTAYGGIEADCSDSGCGLIFRLTPDGTETTLYAFTGEADEGHPVPSLIRDKAGNLYGATPGLGATHGTIFKLDPQGHETVLHAFTLTDGADPYAGVILDTAGNLYGTTVSGGDENCGYGTGCGTVFKIAPDGTETVLYAFDSENNGMPVAPLLLDSSGNLYGTTIGDTGAGGTVFKLAPDGKETVLHTFQGGDGSEPMSGLISDRKGHLYGTAEFGGSGYGTVFEIGK